MFLGKVTRINRWEEAKAAVRSLFGQEAVPWPTISVHLAVEEAYLGIDGNSVVVRTAPHEAACGFSFREGERYLVFAHLWRGELHVSLCSRTRPAAMMADEIEYLQSLPRLPQTSRIYGTAKWYTHDPKFVPKFQPSIMDHYRPPEEYYRAMAPLTGQKIRLQGARGARETVVDTEGRYEFRDLPPGKYELTTRFPGGMTQHGTRTVEVVAKGCAQVDFRAELDGQIRGKLKTAQPVPNLSGFSVYAYRAAEEVGPYDYFLYEYAESDGAFSVGPLPPGEYLLAAQFSVQVPVEGGITFRRSVLMWYPGVASSKEAKHIRVGRGQKVTGYDLVLPIRMEPE